MEVLVMNNKGTIDYFGDVNTPKLWVHQIQYKDSSVNVVKFDDFISGVIGYRIAVGLPVNQEDVVNKTLEKMLKIKQDTNYKGCCMVEVEGKFYIPLDFYNTIESYCLEKCKDMFY